MTTYLTVRMSMMSPGFDPQKFMAEKKNVKKVKRKSVTIIEEKDGDEDDDSEDESDESSSAESVDGTTIRECMEQQ